MGNVGGIIMKFAIAKTEYWKLKGFDVTEWRKSEDGELALVHDRFARMLLPDIDNDNKYNLDKCVRIFPHKMHGEGHFVALLKKDNPDDINRH